MLRGRFGSFNLDIILPVDCSVTEVKLKNSSVRDPTSQAEYFAGDQ